MDRERAKELLPIIEAFAQGKTIEWKSESVLLWTDPGDECEFISRREYRIKPEPREFYIRLTRNHTYWLTPDEYETGGWDKTKFIKVREVPDD